MIMVCWCGCMREICAAHVQGDSKVTLSLANGLSIYDRDRAIA